MTRNLLPLEKAGFIQIEAGTGRIRNVSITQKGTNMIEQAKPLWDKAQAKMEDHLSKKALSTLANTLKQIASLSP